MFNYMNKKSLFLGLFVVIILFGICIGGFFAYRYFFSFNLVVDEYSFQYQKYPNYSVDIYNNDELVRNINLPDTNIAPTLFSVSPNNKYVVFKTGIIGGTCVYKASPTVVDLTDFSIVSLDDSNINIAISDVLGVDITKVIKFSATQDISDIKWISNDKIEASMQFGDDSGCQLDYANKPSNLPESIGAKVIYTIVK